MEALEELRRRFDVVICEGAGSPAEINLLDHDLVNLRVAQAAGFPALVVGDIDRGGVFAALYGTVALLPDDLRPLVKGFVINKLRGDPALLGDGPAELERRTGVPTIGVLPYIRDVALDAEDSLALDGRRPRPVPPATLGGSVDGRRPRPVPPATLGGSVDGRRPRPVPPATLGGPERDPIDVAVIRFPRISNFTDLDALAIEPGVTVRLIETRGALGDPDLIILPGTKSTVADLAWLRGRGFPDAIDEARRQRRATVLGICGGYQMLGQRIADPIESAQAQAVAGLGWLPVVTTFEATKVTRQRRGRPAADGGGGGAGDRGGTPAATRVSGYQIHHGRTTNLPAADPWLLFDDAYGSGYEGAVAAEGAVLGTSLHGLFEEDGFRSQFLEEVARRRAKRWHDLGVSFAAARETQIDRLADLLDAHLDLAAIKAMLT
jgi:adenosylcobyric acid synthase